MGRATRGKVKMLVAQTRLEILVYLIINFSFMMFYGFVGLPPGHCRAEPTFVFYCNCMPQNGISKPSPNVCAATFASRYRDHQLPRPPLLLALPRAFELKGGEVPGRRNRFIRLSG